MKNILLIMLFLGILLISTNLSAQDKMDKLSDKIDKLAEQMATQQIETSKQITELAKQQAITATKVDSIDKRFDSLDKRLDGIDKRIDMQSNLTLGMMAFLAVLIGVLIWDRRAANAPLEKKTEKLKEEVDILKQQELKHQEKELKNEALLKKILDKFPDLAGLA